MFDLTPKPQKNLDGSGRCPDCGIFFQNWSPFGGNEVPAHRCGSEPTLSFDGQCPRCKARWGGLAHKHRAYVPDHWCNPPPPPLPCYCPFRHYGRHKPICGVPYY